MSISYAVFCLYCSRGDFHSFPTRRSSDLTGRRINAGYSFRSNVHSGSLAGFLRCGNRLRHVVETLLTSFSQPPSWFAQSFKVAAGTGFARRSEEHTSELQSHVNLVCRLLLILLARRFPLFPYTTLFRSDRSADQRGIFLQEQCPLRIARGVLALRQQVAPRRRNLVDQLFPTTELVCPVLQGRRRNRIRTKIGRAHV